MKSLSFFDYNNTLLELEDLIKTNTYFEDFELSFDGSYEYSLKCKSNSLFGFSFNLYPDFRRSLLEINIRESNNKKDFLENLIEILADKFYFFELLQCNFTSFFPDEDFYSSKAKFKTKDGIAFIDDGYSTITIANSENGSILLDLFSSDNIKKYSRDKYFTFNTPRNYDFEKFEFEVKIDYELYPKPALNVYFGSKDQFELYYQDNFKGNIYKKLYSKEDISNCFLELNELSNSFVEFNNLYSKEINNLISKDFYGYGLNYDVSDFGPLLSFNCISEILSVQLSDNIKFKKSSDVIKYFELEKDFICHTKNILDNIITGLEDLNIECVNSDDFVFKFLSDSKTNIKLNFLDKSFYIYINIDSDEIYSADNILTKEKFNDLNLSYSHSFSDTGNDSKNIKFGELHQALISEIKEIRNKIRFKEILKPKQ